MNRATSTALRAIVTGLRKSGAISEPHVEMIVREFEAAEAGLEQWGGAERIQFRQLCMNIASDAGIETSIKVADDADWRL